jgi:deuterolysin
VNSWSFPELAGDCSQDDLDRGGSILHEMTHLFGTADNAYGQTDCMALSAADAANNADTYE